MRSPVTLRSHRVTAARPAGLTIGVSTRQPGPSQKAGRNSPHRMCHTAPVFPASMDMTQHSHDLHPQATPDMTNAVTDVPTSSPAVQAGLHLAAAAGSAVAR